jgi:hypothetical protein
MRHDGRTWGRAAAWSLGGLTLLELAALLVLLALNASRVGAARLISDALLAVAIGLGAAVGQLIISRRPRNAVGWLLGLAGLSLAASMFTEQYALQGLAIVHARHGPAVIQASLPVVIMIATFVLNRLMAVPRGSRSSTFTGRSASREVMRGWRMCW